MRNLIEFILLNLVLHPDDVHVTEEEVDGRYEYLIEVHPEDVGRVIGRQGRIIRAIRSLAKVRAMKENIMVNIRIQSEQAPEPSAVLE